MKRGKKLLPIKIDLQDGFLREEKRDGYLVPRSMKKVWAVELDLLVEFDRVCRLLNISYVLDGGTLLGAVRHKGFIPWDDDIDVIMLRKDYDILVKKGARYFKKPYFLQTPYTDKAYFRPHAQLRNSKTTGYLYTEGKNYPFNQGIFIDIFVLDGLTLDTGLLKKQISRQNRLRFVYTIKGCPFSNKRWKTVLKTILAAFFELFFDDCISLYRKREQVSERYSSSEYVDAIGFRRKLDAVRYLKREWFMKTVDIEFENRFFPAPKDYNKVLKVYFGDKYMIPKKAASKHGRVFFDAERSYKEVLYNQK